MALMLRLFKAVILGSVIQMAENKMEQEGVERERRWH